MTQHQRQAPLFSKARFGPGIISILVILLAFSILLIFYFKLYYLAILPAMLAVALFAVKYFENIRLPEETREKKLIGQTCLVIKKVTKSERGIVQVYRDSGRLDNELWSAELSIDSSDVSEIEQGQIVRIVGVRSIILVVEPLAKKGSS